jgi:TrmH family RNA methyltransferase
VIESAANQTLKRVRALTVPRTRRKHAQVLVEGPRHLDEARLGGGRALDVLVRGPLAQATDGVRRTAGELREEGARVHEVDEALFDQTLATEHAQGLAGVFQEPASPSLSELVEPSQGPVLIAVLCEVQDPGNVGTMLRTAAAFGLRGVVLTRGTADPFAPKVVRSAAGALFRLPLVRASGDPEEALRQLAGAGVWCIAAAKPGDHPREVFAGAGPRARPLAIVVGNEGRGLTDAQRALCEQGAWIPTEVESLNVAGAFSILAYLAREAANGG